VCVLSSVNLYINRESEAERTADDLNRQLLFEAICLQFNELV